MRLHADFEGGNLGAWETLGPGAVRVSADPGASPRPLWFYFQAEAVDAPELAVELANAADCLGPRHGWNNARPVYQLPGEPWRRSAPGRYQEAEPSTGAPRPGTFHFSVPAPGGAVAVAYCFPYTLADLDAFRRRLGSQRRLCWEVAGQSAAGRPVRIGSVVAAQPPAAASLWVVARQHAGESPASFALEGMVEALLADD